MTTETVSIGADIEEFVSDNNGQIIPVCGLIGGTKREPLPTPHGAVQEDNVAVEYNPKPANSEDEWFNNIVAARQDARNILAKFGYTTIAKSSHYFTQKVLQGCGKKAMQFGCVPDINVYNDCANEAPSPFTTLRTAAGHIHIACGNDSELQKAVVRHCDLLLGLPSVALDPDSARRELYGNSGAYRVKCIAMGDPYDGIEYRSLGNWWVDDERLIRWVWGRAQHAYALAKAGNDGTSNTYLSREFTCLSPDRAKETASHLALVMP